MKAKTVEEGAGAMEEGAEVMEEGAGEVKREAGAVAMEEGAGAMGAGGAEGRRRCFDVHRYDKKSASEVTTQEKC